MSCKLLLNLQKKKRTFRAVAALTVLETIQMSGEEKKPDFADVVEAYYDRVLRGAVSVARDRYLAEEIVQETFLSAFRKFDSFSGKSSVFTWLYRIMLNTYCKHHRRKKLLRRLGFVPAESNPALTRRVSSGGLSPDARVANSEESKLLLNAVDRLPAKLRIPVSMHYFDDLTLKEIAEVLNCRLGTVKSRLFQARKRLCEFLQKELGYER
jgi:RNA polymerase sigma-70 factor (ECF subfamily)